MASSTTTPRTFTTLADCKDNPRSGVSRDGATIQWSIWEIDIAEPIEPGKYFIWSNCSHVALEQVAKDALPITVSKVKDADVSKVKRDFKALPKEERIKLIEEMMAGLND